MKIWSYMLAGTAIWCVAGVSPAAAQVAPAAEDGTTERGVDEIIVTAERRASSVQRTSIDVSVVGAEKIQQSVSTAQDITKFVPGVQIGQAGSNTQTYIRGVGDPSGNNFGDPSVSFNLDGVVVVSSYGTSASLYDLERVEVLKGPQGTLYGRNATGGVINAITRRPNFAGLEGYVSAEIGNYGRLKTSGALNVPLTDTLAARASFQTVKHDPYLSDGTFSADNRAARLNLLWEPSDKFSLFVSGSIADEGGTESSGVLSPSKCGSLGCTGKWTGQLDPIAQAVLMETATPGTLFAQPVDGFPPEIDNKHYAVSAEMNWDLGFATLTVLPAYRKGDVYQAGYPGGILYAIQDEREQKSVEVRLGNSSDRLTWLIGGFYLNEDQATIVNTYRQLGFATGAARISTYADLASKALFGQATFSVTDRLRLIGGLRYTKENKDLNSPSSIVDLNGIIPFPIPVEGALSFDKITYKVGVEYDLSQRNMIYATHSTGFRSGGFFNSVSLPNTFNPETITAYEIGSKNRFFDNQLQLNVSAFYWKYKDQIVSFLGYTPSGLTAFVTVNAGQSEIYGLSMDGIVKVGENGTFHLGAEYVKSKYNSFQYDTPVFAVPTTACGVGAPHLDAYGNPVATVDCSGFPVLRAPKWSGVVGYEQMFPLGNGGDVTFTWDGTFASGSYADQTFVQQVYRPAYFVGNFRVDYHAPNKAWSIGAWVRNITNKQVLVAGSSLLNNPTLYDGRSSPPRTYGVTLSANF